jgi:hypothetical protein
MSNIFSGDSWIASAWNTSSPSAGMMGALQSMSASKKYPPGSIKAYMNNNAIAANALSTITASGTTDLTTLAMQAGDLAAQKRQQERAELLQKFVTPPPPPVTLDPFIYFDDGSVLDTVNNVITMVSGKKVNAVTGADWIDPASIVNLANGSYIDTQNNIMYMPDGTKIDTVTGLVISTSA